MTRRRRKQQPDPFYAFRDAVLTDRATALKMLAADPSLLHRKSSVGETALHGCAVENQIDAVAWLLSRGASLNTATDFGDTPLSHAAQLGYVE